MAISEFEIKRCESELEKFMLLHRPPVHIRSQMDFAYRIENQSVVIFEVRPAWNDPEGLVETPVAKATYVKSKKHWKVFWQRADLKWHGYEPTPTVQYFEEFLSLLAEDKHACFFG